METLLDPSLPEVRVDLGLSRAEAAVWSTTRAQAAQLAAIQETLIEAREFPEVYLGPNAAGAEAVEFAERAAIAELALRMQVAEATIRAQDQQATTLRTRTPRVWMAFREGDIATANVRTIADLVQTLPEQVWAAFEDAVFEKARTLAPARFTTFARATRERLQPDPEQRHEVAAQRRRVRLDRDIDGMCWLSAYLPVDDARI